MPVDSETNERATDPDAEADREVPTLSIHETRPGRKVLTEADNTDGWISSDVTVEVSE
jgi:hypothetical protein